MYILESEKSHDIAEPLGERFTGPPVTWALPSDCIPEPCRVCPSSVPAVRALLGGVVTVEDKRDARRKTERERGSDNIIYIYI